jgi:hypothetical protein
MIHITSKDACSAEENTGPKMEEITIVRRKKNEGRVT